MYNNNSNLLIIPTGVYSKKAYDIITRLQEYILTSLNANDLDIINFTFINIKIQPDGEIVLDIDTRPQLHSRSIHYVPKEGLMFSNTTFYRVDKDVHKIKKWLAYRLKEITKKLLWNENWWERNSTLNIDEFSGIYNNHKNETCSNVTNSDILVSDVFCLYDVLLNNKKSLNKYSTELLHSIIGIKRDEKTIEKVISDRIILNKIKEEYKKKMDEITKAYNEELCINKNIISAKYNALKVKELNKFELANKQLEESFKI